LDSASIFEKLLDQKTFSSKILKGLFRQTEMRLCFYRDAFFSLTYQQPQPQLSLQPQPQLLDELLLPHPPQQKKMRIKIMIHQQLFPENPHINSNSLK